VTSLRSCYSDQGSGTKDEAVSKCTAAGGNLPVVLTRAETEYLGLKFPGQEIWIGLTSDRYLKNIFFGVPHWASVFVYFYVIASVAYIHPVYRTGV
jgi:hypothetical protein